ncbi:MAG: hypothetical protein PHF45_00445 [Candidatus Pacebacteria bacterium]|nr:hypothetical protein [Candidatus Paceibacterota bacterium]
MKILRKEVNSMKVALEKICAIIVILQLFFPFLAKVFREIIKSYGLLVNVIIKNNFSTILAALVALLLILWVLADDEYYETEKSRDIEDSNKKISE